ncbi:MAG: nucleotidyltransferase domain-containing protein [Chlorobi bacterium]|nr:nucleotidyltransferase domain-containing protein [Chlorobiota bacterium]
MKETSEIIIIKEIVLQFFPAGKIIMFGSRAKGNCSKNSDYDFIIITEKKISVKEKRNFQAQIRKKLAEHKIPADIIIQNKSEVKIKENIKGHIIRQAVKEGVEL